MLRSGLIYFVGRMSVALITLLAIAVYTRLLSPAEYGIYALVLTSGTMAYAGLVQWLTFALGRFMPAYQGRQEIILAHAAAGYLAVALFVVLAAPFVIARLLPGIDDRIWLLAIAFFVTMSFAEMNLVVFQMREKPRLYVRFALLRVVLSVAIGILLAYEGRGAAGLLLGLVVGNVGLILPNLHAVWRSVRPAMLERGMFRELAAYGFPFALTGAFAAVIHASDRYIIGALIGTDAAGLYSAPYDLAQRSLGVLMVVMAMASQPIVFRAFEAEGRAVVEPLICRQGELLLGAALPAALGIALLSPAIAHVFFGQAFQASARELMPWIAAATVVSGLQSFFLSLAFSLPKQPLRQSYIFVAGAVANVLLNFLLIPRFGLLGAAYATLAAYALIVVGSFVLGRRLFRLPLPSWGLAKILLACAALVLALWPVRATTALLPVILHGLAGTALYVLVFCSLDIAETRAPAGRMLHKGLGRLGFGRAGH